MGKRVKILTIILIVVALYAFYYLAIPAIIDLNKLNPYITGYIKKNYGFDIQLVSPSFKMGYTPSIWIKADSFKILNKDKSDALSVEKPVMEISILPLVIGKFNLTYFSADDIYADVFIDKNFIIGLGDYLFLKTSNFVIDISNSKIIINNFIFNLTDKIKMQNAIINGNYFYLEKYKKNKYLKTSSDISIKSGNNFSVVNFNIDTKLPFKAHLDDFPPEVSASVTNFKFENFSNFINTFSNGKIQDVSGKLDLELHSDKVINGQKQYISNLLLDNFSCDASVFDKPFSYPYKIQVKSSALLSGNNLSIPSLSVKTPKFNGKLSGAIKNISSRKPVPDINIKFIDQRAENILELLPYSKKFDDIAKIGVSVIKDALFDGNVNTDVYIKDDIIEPFIYGDIIIDDAYVARPIKKAPKNAYIGIHFKGKKLDLKVNVPTDKKQEVNVGGVIDVYGEQDADLHITSTDLIDLSEAERILMPVHKAFRFLLGPVPIMGFEGFGSIDLRVTGTKRNPHTFGWFKTKGATTYFDDIPQLVLKNADSILTFDDFNTSFKLMQGTVNGKSVNIDGTCDLSGKFDFDAILLHQNAEDLLNILKTSKMLSEFSQGVNFIDKLSGLSDLSVNIKGHLLDINDMKIGKNVHSKGVLTLNNVSAKLYESSAFVNNIFGSIKFNDFLYNLDLSTKISKSEIKIFGNIEKNIASIKFVCEKIRFSELLKVIQLPEITVLPQNSGNSSIKLSGQYNGNITNFDINKLKADGQIILNDFNLVYNPLKLPIKVISGQINIRNNLLELSRINADIGTARTVIGGKIYNLSKNPNLDLSVYSRLNQKFADYIYNYSAIYPVKIRGDVVLTSLISGKLNNPVVKANVKIDKNSSIYYMGAALGEEQNPINLSINSSYENKILNVRSFTYDKVIQNSLSSYNVRQLNANGILYINDLTNIGFKNFKVLTNTHTDTKIFNIIFGKPLIKTGTFTSNLTINGNLQKPNLIGSLNLYDVNIPFIDASIKDISTKFMPNNITAKISGNILSNSFELNANAQNKLYPPFIINEASLKSEDLNIDNFISSLNDSSVELVDNDSKSEYTNFDLSQLIIKKFFIFAKNVYVNNFNANKLEALITLNNGKFSVENFKFNLAKGEMNGSAGYDMKSNHYDFDLNVHNADADSLTKAIFDIKGQIYGDLDGKMTLSCKGSNQAECLKSLNGYSAFQVKDGRMPKLGSLEYLLKAGNLLKSGITGLSINGILDLVVPLKTGNFDYIKGAISIKDGIADNIQIITNGKDLNLFITGEYNLSTYIADMYVFGRLSKKIATPFGPIGNASLNTLFNTIPGVDLNKTDDKGLINGINKIPGLELSSKLFRVFAAEIHGDITGEDYVESFRWIE